MLFNTKTICPKCSKRIKEIDTHFCPSCGIRLSCDQETGYIDMSALSGQAFEPSRPSTFDAPEPCHLAGFWIRMGAFWMDWLIILLIAIFLGSLAYSTAIGRELFPNLEKINLFIILLFIFYHALFLGRFKTTPGKKFFGLMIIPKNEHTGFSYAEAFLRTLSYFISELFLGIGFLWIALDRKKQAWHDKIAKTLVVRKTSVPLLRRTAALFLATLIVLIMIALQFNLTWVYQSVFRPGKGMGRNHGEEIVSVLVTQREIRNGMFKDINTRNGQHTVRLPSSAIDGDIFKVHRSDEEGGVFYIKIVIVEWI